MKNKIIVSVKNLTTIFNKKTPQEIKAINNFSYDFEENKIHYIIGNSGSGKSTLVQHFNGLIKSNQGDIRIGDYYIYGKKKKIPPIKKLRSFVSIVFQYPEYQIFKDTIRNEIMFGPISFGLHKKLFYLDNFKKLTNAIKNDYKIINPYLNKKINNEEQFKNFVIQLNKAKIIFKSKKVIIKNSSFSSKKIVLDFQRIPMDEIITKYALKFMKKLGIPLDYLNHSPFGLSGGQKRRVAIAGILVINPHVLIFDEPTAGLDPQGVKEMMDIIKEEKKNGKTLFIITHSMDEVLECGDNVIVMDGGKVIASGNPYDVFLDKNLYNKTKISKPKVIHFIDELNRVNDKYKNLYQIKPKTCEELAEAIVKLM